MSKSNVIVALLMRGCRAGPEQSMRLVSLIFPLFKDSVRVCVSVCVSVCVCALICLQELVPG